MSHTTVRTESGSTPRSTSASAPSLSCAGRVGRMSRTKACSYYLLVDCDAVDHGRAYEHQYTGASYRQLAKVAHLAGCSACQRIVRERTGISWLSLWRSRVGTRAT